MEIYTNSPCVQFYSGNFIKNAAYPFKGGYVQTPQILFCLETQFMPDSINKPHFTNCILKPGEIYDYTTEYRFSAK
jgi:aldose 1-epimerase